MSTVIDSLERQQLRRVPAFQAGDRVRVHFQVVEGNRRRTQVFEGVVIKRQGEGVRETFTVRKNSFGVGVERTFPVHSPKIERIEVAARGDVRRAKLYYLRGRVGKRARVRERRYVGPEEAVRGGAAARSPRPRLPRRPTTRCPATRSTSRRSPTLRPRARRAPWPTRRRAEDGRRADEPRAARRPRRPQRSRRPRTPRQPPRPTSPSRRRGGKGVVGVGLAARAGPHRRRRARARARHPGVPRQALPHPERVDGADARDRPARARQPAGRAFRDARGRRRRGLPPAGRRRAAGRAGLRQPSRPRARCAAARRRAVRGQLHQARRGGPGGPDPARRGPRDPQRQAPGRAVLARLRRRRATARSRAR